MEGRQIPTDFTTETLSKRVVFLEAAIAIKDAVISEKSDELIRLSAELEAEKFK